MKFATPHHALTRATALGALLTCTFAGTFARAADAQIASGATFINGITINGNSTDLATGSTFDRRLGMFSDLFYDPLRNEWWGIADRGPGGGLLPYQTRVERFTLDVNSTTGQISNFQVAATVLFTSPDGAFNGMAPKPTNVLGNALDPEGIVINPVNGHLLVSDEYGPSILEFDRDGTLVRRFTTPPNLIGRNAVNVPNFANDVGNVAGRTTNRGFEGLAISPDGKYAFAILQSAMLEEGSGNGEYTRIVKFDVATGTAIGEFAYHLDTAAQGRGVSAMVALGNDKFLVIERNNRGVGVGATLNTADKNVYEIDLAGATDITNISIPNGVLPAGVTTVTKISKVIDLDMNTLSALGDKSPEKWEGLAIGPQLSSGNFLVLAGTDNDFSVTQNSAGTQFDVYFNYALSDPYASSIQCPLGQTTGCFLTSNNNTPAVLTSNYSLLPGVLQGYNVSIDGYIPPTVVPEPQSLMMLAAGVCVIGLATIVRRRLA